MLLRLAVENDDGKFKQLLDEIKTAFWPYEKFLNEDTLDSLTSKINKKSIPKGNNNEKILYDDDHHHNYISEIMRQIALVGSRDKLYNAYKADKGKKFPIPFLEYYHQLFFKRKYGISPSINLQSKAFFKQILNLKKNKDGEGNYSQHSGNYDHFINVIVATARLINYFSESKCKEILNIDNIDIGFQENQVKRIFNLMLAAFYHDLGKTIVDRRHGMEGSIILLSHKSTAWRDIDAIWAYCTGDEEFFEQEDLISIADMLLYHDVYGTLSTGESGYIKLVDYLDNAKSFSFNTENPSQLAYWKLFDLWLLNIADIMVSMKEKYIPAENLFFKESAEKEIITFLSGKKGELLKHDLKLSIKIAESHFKSIHSSDTTNIESESMKQTRLHVEERIRRLVHASIEATITRYEKRYKSKEMIGLIDKLKTLIGEDNKLTHIIKVAIKTTGDFQEFIKRASMVGHMDYSLGFFSKIIERAFDQVNLEISSEESDGRKDVKQSVVTKWIRAKDGDAIQEGPFLDKINATFFMENYVSLVIRILNHILFRERSFDTFRNLEFSDANERLNDDKIDCLIGLEGPNRSQRATELILKTIFYW